MLWRTNCARSERATELFKDYGAHVLFAVTVVELRHDAIDFRSISVCALSIINIDRIIPQEQFAQYGLGFLSFRARTARFECIISLPKTRLIAP